MNYGLLIFILFPMVAGIISYILGIKNKKNRNDWVDIALFVEAVLLCCLIYEQIKGYSMEFKADVVFGMGFRLIMEPVRLLFCGVTLAVNFVVSQFVKESLKKEEKLNGFYFLFLTLQGLCYGAIMSDMIFGFVMFLSFAFLIVLPLFLQRQNEMILKSVKVYSVFMAISYSLAITGMLILFSKTYTTSFDMLFLYGGSEPDFWVTFSGSLLIVCFGMWAGMFPLQHIISKPSNVGLIEVSTILSCILSKLGVFGMIITARSIFRENRLVSKILLVWALGTVVWGLIEALLSTDIRRILMGINMATNGIIGVAGSIILLNLVSSNYVNRAMLYLLISSSLSLCILYMVTLELVREARTYEIKGLIAVGKGHKLLLVTAFVACASLIGVPGTMGFLGQSLLIKSMLTTVKWKWLIVVYVLEWAFYMTAIARFYMKLFISKKDEAMHVLASEEELLAGNVKKEPSDPKNAYWFDEIILVALSLVLLLVGILYRFSVEKLSVAIDSYFHMIPLETGIPYFTMDVLLLFLISVLLAFILYFNLVHGVMLRAVLKKKNKKIQEGIDSEKE